MADVLADMAASNMGMPQDIYNRQGPLQDVLGEGNKATFSAIKTLYNATLSPQVSSPILVIPEKKSFIITNVWSTTTTASGVKLILRHLVEGGSSFPTPWLSFVVDGSSTDNDKLSYHAEGGKVLESGSTLYLEVIGGGTQETGLTLDGVEIAQV